MPCFRPLRAYQASPGSPVSFVERPGDFRSLDLACGQCIGCRLERSRQWAVRIVHESRLWPANSFVTLTYAQTGPSLVYRDFQLFMKRLRKAGFKPRFFMCGEYGPDGQRPHFHAILFNVHFGDRRAWSKASDGSTLWRSPTLERLWPHGHSSIGSVSFQSAAYVARYCVSKVTGDDAAGHYRLVDVGTGEVTARVPEFARMSLRPGIGFEWFQRYRSDWYQSEAGDRLGTVVLDGREQKAPKFYDRKFAKLDDERAAVMEYERISRARERAADNTNERLAVREQVTLARAAKLRRTVE